jgi:hypothetical protein
MARIDDKVYQDWLELCSRIKKQTTPIRDETPEQKRQRISELLLIRNFEKFCQYYFPHYIDSKFGWFHKKAANEILSKENVTVLLEWAREHAKSVFADVFIPLWLKATGQLDGMILASETEAKAAKLIGDVQAELMNNKAYINDFGEQRTIGSWSDGSFITADGIGFWSFGIGQNPAGVRNAGRRPNYGVVDDAASKKRAKNQELVKQDLDWVNGEFLGCLSIKGKRLVFANNRTAKNDLTAHFAGDVKEGDPIRPGIVHIKVFATEDPVTHKMLLIENGGVPAWPRYTVENIQARILEMGYRSSRRQFYHQHIEDGDIFREEHLPWDDVLPLDEYDQLITYNDPSYKGAKKNDFKAIVLVGRKGKYYHIIWAWVRQASRVAMVSAHYDIDEAIRKRSFVPGLKPGHREVICPHYLEANFLQEELYMSEYDSEGESRGKLLRLRADKRAKPDKFGRIEDLSPLAERGLIVFNKKLQKNSDMITLREQFLAFPNGHDDGPDAVEGAIYLLTKTNRRSDDRPAGQMMGKYKHSSARQG